MAEEPLSRERAFTTAGLVTLGMLLVGWGIGNGIDNIVSHAHGEPWTVSLGGTLAGLGGAMVIGAVLARRSAAWWCYVPGVIGAVLTGYGLGGGIDDLLREIDGGDHGFALGMALCGLGVGLAAASMLLAKRWARAVPT